MPLVGLAINKHDAPTCRQEKQTNNTAEFAFYLHQTSHERFALNNKLSKYEKETAVEP